MNIRGKSGVEMIRRMVAALEARDPANFELAMIQSGKYFDALAPVADCRQGLEYLTAGIINAAERCFVPEMLSASGVSDSDLRKKITTEYLAAHDALPVLPEFGIRWSAEWGQKCIHALNLARITDEDVTDYGVGRWGSGSGSSFSAALSAAQSDLASAEEEPLEAPQNICIAGSDWVTLRKAVNRITTRDAGTVYSWARFRDVTPTDVWQPEIWIPGAVADRWYLASSKVLAAGGTYDFDPVPVQKVASGWHHTVGFGTGWGDPGMSSVVDRGLIF